jgi:catechol 2,3-dioxygenase-like lactoylglutathione lyase family enzyme
MVDVGLTHVALPVTDLAASIAFYKSYAAMEIVHQREGVVWLSDRTRPFVIVLARTESVESPLRPFGHLGVGVPAREDVDRLAARARSEGVLILGPLDSGYPVGYWALLRDPDGHTLEVAYGQEVGLTVEKSS